MKVEKLPSEGGIRISEVAFEGDPFTIERLGLGGETLVRFTGMDLNYTAEGALNLAVVKFGEFARAQGSEMMAALDGPFWETVFFLASAGIEIIAEVDLERGEVVLFQKGRLGKDFLTSYDLAHYSGRVMPIEVGSENSIAGVVGFLALVDEEKNRLELGVSDLKNAIWVRRPLMANMANLDGRVDLLKMKDFLTGK